MTEVFFRVGLLKISSFAWVFRGGLGRKTKGYRVVMILDHGWMESEGERGER